MCRSQCLLLVLAVTVAVAHSWDIAVTTKHQVEFYENKTKTHIEGALFQDLTALAYDAVHNMLLFVDKQSDNASIFSYHLATKKYQSLVKRRAFENIQGLAFDPVESLLFWTDATDKSIFWMSLRPGSNNDMYGNLLMKMDEELPRGIAVDSCRGYIYWTNTLINRASIERARFNGSDREIVVDTDIYMPVSIAVDQQTQRLYWADDREGIHYSIESSDLNGKNRKTLLKGQHHQPNALSVSKDSIYWTDWGFNTVWKIPKIPKGDVEPQEHIVFSDDPFGVVTNYKIEDQIENAPECEALRNQLNSTGSINDTYSIPPDMGLFCVHGFKVPGQLQCNCSAGYTGERCDISVCRNYCLEGHCSVTTNGQPQCKCKEGYIGERCEINVCYAYCLNNGVCTWNEQHQPICKCSSDYEGTRCETLIPLTTTAVPTTIATETSTTNSSTDSNSTTCNCGLNPSKSVPFIPDDSDIEYPSCNAHWDSYRDPAILFLLTWAVSATVLYCVVRIKMNKWKVVPRIKRHIIVNKNLTPMTARPDQCEITIENCCNMNICETPCFEPCSTIRPSLLDSKPGKEEKKNLIANMECPDNY